jgi:hypothetical protein
VKTIDELVAEADGGHIQYVEKGKHSFEEMLTTIFRPEDLKAVSITEMNWKIKFVLVQHYLISK